MISTPWSLWNVGDAVQVTPQEVDDLVGEDGLGVESGCRFLYQMGRRCSQGQRRSSRPS